MRTTLLSAFPYWFAPNLAMGRTLAPDTATEDPVSVLEQPATEAVLDQRLRSAWPHFTWRPIGDIPRTIVVMQSISAYLPPAWQPLLPAYEERYLCYLLGLLSPGTHITYVTSMPVHPRLVDYWLGLVPGQDDAAKRNRLTMVPVVDARPIPLTRKVLEHPGVMRRIRDTVQDFSCAVTVGHTVTEEDVAVAGILGVPVYGAHPRHAFRGTKSGSRDAFERAGVPLAPGVSGLRTKGDLAEALAGLRSQFAPRRVIVKLDEGAGGIGNGTIDLDAFDVRDARALCDEIALEQPEIAVDDYYAHLEREGAVVEVFLEGDEVRSPSVQLRLDPFGQPEIISTHEQLMGGPHGLTFLGSTMPASPEYVAQLTEQALAVGALLGSEGVVGRCSIDFLAVRTGESWTTYASEINLRAGGTTHPAATLSALTRGSYDADAGLFLSGDGTPKFYKATDHLESPAYAALTTDDLLDLLPASGIGWDPEAQTGAVFHMASAIGGTGNVGVTAMADSPAAASALFERCRAALDGAARSL